MKRLLPILLVILLLCGCGESPKTWQEEYDLGVRYLSEGNYDEAILAFEAAIGIDPKRAEAYLGLADVYVAQGDLDAAREVLDRAVEAVGENEEVLAKIGEITAAGDPGGAARTEREDFEDGSYCINEFDANDVLLTHSLYDADGTLEDRSEYMYDADGKIVSSTEYAADGSVLMYSEYEVDGNGNPVRQMDYGPDGTLWETVQMEYDSDNKILRRNSYDADGTLYCVTDFQSQGNRTWAVRSTYYNPDGTVDHVEEGN